MPVYIPTGKLGAGKSLWSMKRIREAMEKGLPIATNMDLFLEHLPKAKAPIYRIPDYPTVAALEAIGVGSDSKEEETFGWLVLDEAAVWLNARDWGQGERAGVIAWLRHARKLHWNVILMSQGAGSIDKQIRDDLLEYHVICRRMDRMRMPVVGRFLEVVSLGKHNGKLPKIHMAAVRYGYGQNSMLSETEYYKAHDLYKCYDTDQVIARDYPHGIYCQLPPAPPPQPAPVVKAIKPKLRGVEMVMRLDPDKRLAFMRTLSAKGLDLAAI